MLSKILLENSFCIYGAGIVATSIYKAIKTVYKKQPRFFLVSDAAEGKKDENPMEIDAIPVIRFSLWQSKLSGRRDVDYSVLTRNDAVHSQPYKYLIAVPEIHHLAIEHSLSLLGVKKEDIMPITSKIENQIMEEYYRILYPLGTVQAVISGDMECESKSNLYIEEGTQSQKEEIQVLQAKCHVDKPLQSKIEIPQYVLPIQVGTVFTDRRIADLQDNVGENISEKNRNYCELTATYYAWKNSKAAYKGLCHYRRIFDITKQQMERLLKKSQEWDVILPYPSVHYPNISMQHTRYLCEEDWRALLQALREITPEYLKVYEMAVASGEQYFLNFNMLIAKAEIFDDYCDFLFRVLARAEELTVPKGKERADRFAGYMGENLTTIYFLKNRDRLNIIYSGKLWIT